MFFSDSILLQGIKERKRGSFIYFKSLFGYLLVAVDALWITNKNHMYYSTTMYQICTVKIVINKYLNVV